MPDTHTDPRAAQVLAIGLLEGVRQCHRDPEDSEYNECESVECQWCEDAGKVIAALAEQEPPEGPWMAGQQRVGGKHWIVWHGERGRSNSLFRGSPKTCKFMRNALNREAAREGQDNNAEKQAS